MSWASFSWSLLRPRFICMAPHFRCANKYLISFFVKSEIFRLQAMQSSSTRPAAAWRNFGRHLFAVLLLSFHCTVILQYCQGLYIVRFWPLLSFVDFTSNYLIKNSMKYL
jgi:hypothetical protein